MSRLALFLLGSPRLEREGVPVEFARCKNVALIAYLAMTGTSHTRESLITLLWPELEPSRARASLRRNLSMLRRALGEDQLVTGGDSIGLDPTADLVVDVDQFHMLLRSWQDHGHPEAEVCPECLSSLAEAVELYRGDFLEGFTLPDSASFDDWQFFQTEGLRQELGSALERLVRAYGAQGEYETAIRYARRWLSLNRLHEPAHRELMRLSAQAGQRAAALRQYRECEQVLDSELGVLPEEETTRLHRAIKEGRHLEAPVAPAILPGVVERKHNLPVQPAPPSRYRPDDAGFPVDARVPLDVADLEAAIGKAKDAAKRGLLDLAREYLEEVLRSDRDDLLAGDAVSPTATVRGRYVRLRAAALERLVRLLEGQESYAAAVEYARRLRRYDPLYDDTYQRLVHLHVLSADRAGALRGLQRRLLAATRGRGALVLIHGPAGIGKTSLANAYREKVCSLGAVFAAAHCSERATAPAYAPWHDLLRQLQSLAGMDLDMLPEPFGSAPPAGTAYRLMQAVSESLRQAAAESPLVLLLDDLHWADQDTLDLLDFVSRRLSDLPLLVIVTYRSEEVHRRHPLYGFMPTLQRDRPVETIRLAPLSPSGTARLVEARHGACSPALATYLHERSGGNPPLPR